MDRIRVVRILVYEGPRDKVEDTLARSTQGTKVVGSGSRMMSISAMTIGGPPEVIGQAEEKTTVWEPAHENIEETDNAEKH